MPRAVLDPEVHTHLGTYSQGLVPARGGSPADKEVGTAQTRVLLDFLSG